MNTNDNTKSTSLLLAIFLVGGGLAACTTQEAKSDAGKGGTSGSGTGGAGGSATGSGGSGVDAGYATSEGVMCPLPAMALITDFSQMVPDGGVDPDAGAPATDYVHFGDSTTLGGSEYVYPTATQNPTYPVTSNISAGNWHISGNLGDYSGFGLYFDNCSRINAAAYRGVSFTISGTTLPPGSIVTMGMGTLKNVIAASWLMSHGNTTVTAGAPGLCIPASGTNQYDQPTCGDATKQIPITSAATTVTVLWTDFAGGKPEPAVTPSDITSVYWFFPPPTGAGTATPTPYMVDITIDNLSFVQ